MHLLGVWSKLSLACDPLCSDLNWKAHIFPGLSNLFSQETKLFLHEQCCDLSISTGCSARQAWRLPDLTQPLICCRALCILPISVTFPKFPNMAALARGGFYERLRVVKHYIKITCLCKTFARLLTVSLEHCIKNNHFLAPKTKLK